MIAEDNKFSKLIFEKWVWILITNYIIILDMEIAIISSSLELTDLEENILKSVKISPYYDDRALKVASIWEQVALKKACLAEDSNEKEQFIACAHISLAIANSLAYPADYRSYYVCRDEKGQDQGMMVLEMKPNKVYVALLVTNPHNIRSKVNEDEPNKVKGAGTCLLQKAEELARNEGKESIVLHPVSTAITFYEKNGFEWDDLYSMAKKVQKISEEFLVA